MPTYTTTSEPLLFGARVHDGKAGFTLIELMVVVLVISIAAGLGGGFYLRSYRRLMVEKAARDVRLMARYARIAAIEQQQPLYLLIDRANNRAMVATSAFFSGQTDPGSIVTNQFCRPVMLPAGVYFEDVSTEAAAGEDLGTDDLIRICFMPDGTANWAVVAIGDGKTHYALIINGATGATRIVASQADLLSEQLVVDLEAG
ncbi:MAG: prepilin-type N-terminal cleavage/methylation domain-containing protein [Sedimentisphaerales bacterium]|nr:prepilin-type N-terminal cleavage/methylation domain-containing protein [Sedimentisphaerales bacterium]